MISGDHIAMKTAASMMMPVFVPGLQRWQAEDRVNELNGQDASHEGYENPDPGSKSVTISGTMVVDITTGSITAFAAGTILSDIGFYADKDAADPIYLLDEFLMLECRPQGEVQGRFTLEFRGKSRGPFGFNDPN